VALKKFHCCGLFAAPAPTPPVAAAAAAGGGASAWAWTVCWGDAGKEICIEEANLGSRELA